MIFTTSPHRLEFNEILNLLTNRFQLPLLYLNALNEGLSSPNNRELINEFNMKNSMGKI